MTVRVTVQCDSCKTKLHLTVEVLGDETLQQAIHREMSRSYPRWVVGEFSTYCSELCAEI